jgi:hypothetical protein
MRKIFTLAWGLILSVCVSAQIVQMEDFNSCALPAGWAENVVSGDSSWWFVDNSPNPLNAGNLDGTCMVLFDDDWMGSGATPSHVELLSPAIDLTVYSVVELEFDYNFQEFGALNDRFEVDVWDGASWVNVLSINFDDCGVWGLCGPPYPHAVIDVTPYINSSFQVRYSFIDDGEWSWYLGIDNHMLIQPPADDLGITDITPPTSGGCALTAAEVINVEVSNLGSADASGFNVCYTVDGPLGPTTVCEPYGATLTAGSVAPFSFATTVDMSTPGLYTITAYTDLAGDVIPSNDSMMIDVDFSLAAIPIDENFDSYAFGTTVFATPWINETVTDQLDFQVNFGPTGSVATGPTDDVSGGGGYIYTETSGSLAGDSAILESECIDLSSATSPALEYAYHFYGGSIDYVRVFVVDGPTVTEVEAWIGQQQFDNTDPWLFSTVDLSAWAGSVIKLRFVAKIKTDASGFTFNGDVSLDEIVVREIGAADLGVTEVTAPVLGSCLLSTTETISIEITNFGTADQTAFDVCYIVDGPLGLSSGCENVGALSVTGFGGTALYDFVSTVDMSAPGTYTITAYTDLPTDISNANDSTVYILTIDAPVALPIVDNFDTYSDGSTVFASDLVNITTDAMEWQVNFGPTGSVDTGPDDDVSGGGGYIYTESSAPFGAGDQGILRTQCIDLTTAINPEVAFSYHMYGGSIDFLDLNVIAGGTSTNLVNFDGQQQFDNPDPWLDTVVDLTAYTGQVIRLEWVGQILLDTITGFTFNGDNALDEIAITDPLPNDGGVISVDAPSSACDLTASEIVSVTIENFGTTDLTAFDVAYTVNGGAPVVENVGALFIPVGGTGSYTFATGADLSVDGSYTIQAYTNIIADGNVSNDSSSIVVENLIATGVFPYVETFDAATNCGDAAFACLPDGDCVGAIPGGWTQNVGDDDIDWSSTDLATPSGGTGPSADHTSGSGYYLFLEGSGGCNDQVGIVTSPCFDLSAVTCPQANFWYHMWGDDMGTLTLEINAGSGWDTLWSLSGDQGDQWLEASVSLAAYAGLGAQFRFTGRTGLIGFETDMGIDDFSITDNSLDVSPTAISSPASGCEVGLVSVDVELSNESCLAAPSFDVTLEIGGSMIVTDTYPAGLAGLTTVTHTFTVPFDFAAPANYDVRVYTQLAGDGAPENDTLDVVIASVLPPTINTGFDSSYCAGTTVFPTPLIPGGTWSGVGIVNPVTGEFDPSIVGSGGSTDITYTFTPTGSYTVSAIPFAPTAPTAPIGLPLGDDDAINVPIGFSFDMFGDIYSDVWIHSNGYMSFTSNAVVLFPQFLPDPFDPNAVIAVAWDDLNPTEGISQVSYETVGSAPNRQFIMYYNNLSHFGAGGGLTVTAQVILYEGTNIIDIVVTNIDSDGGLRTQGIENADGTEAFTSTLFTNQQDFTQTNEAYRYAPTPCGNTITETVMIEAVTPVVIPDLTLCFGESGTLDAGPGGASYLWSTGETTQIITVDMPGTYTVDVLDAGGCTAMGSAVVDISAPISFDGGKTNVECFGESTGGFDLTINGGTPPYLVIWSTGDTATVLTGLPAGDYGVAVVDANGCSASGTENIREPDEIIIDLTGTDPSFGATDGAIDANISGGIDPFTYSWSSGETTEDISGLSAGTYTLTVTDSAGCTSSAAITLSELPNSIESIEFLEVLDLYPNPSDGLVQLTMSLNEVQDVQIEIYNITGQLIDATRTEKTLGTTWSFDLSEEAAGSYQVKIHVGEYVIARPLIITN